MLLLFLLLFFPLQLRACISTGDVELRKKGTRNLPSFYKLFVTEKWQKTRRSFYPASCHASEPPQTRRKLSQVSRDEQQERKRTCIPPSGGVIISISFVLFLSSSSLANVGNIGRRVQLVVHLGTCGLGCCCVLLLIPSSPTSPSHQSKTCGNKTSSNTPQHTKRNHPPRYSNTFIYFFIDSLTHTQKGKIKILFGTQTGTAEDFSRTLAREAKKYHIYAQVVDMEVYDTVCT